MPQDSSGGALRADAQRNRERILAAAEEVFAVAGPDAGIAEIARRAGVGPATVCRRFPTKEALWIELMRSRMEELTAAARREARQRPVAAGLERFMQTLAARFAADRGLHETSADRCVFAAELATCRHQLVDAVRGLLESAQAAGRIRADLVVEDVFSLCAAANHRISPAARDDRTWQRHLAVILDGLRSPHPSALPVAAIPLTEVERRHTLDLEAATP